MSKAKLAIKALQNRHVRGILVKALKNEKVRKAVVKNVTKRFLKS
jgi:hypothetical protein